MVQVPTVDRIYLRPAILVPVTFLTGLPAEQIEALLAHELAHIRRNDYLVSVLQSVAEVVLFYHPAVWWISRQIREEREFCCDDLAVTAGIDVLTYLRARSQRWKRRARVSGFSPRPTVDHCWPGFADWWARHRRRRTTCLVRRRPGRWLRFG